MLTLHFRPQDIDELNYQRFHHPDPMVMKRCDTGMTNEMPNASDQSCLNRFLTEVEWDEEAMNQARIDWLQQFDDTQFHERGT